MSHIVVIGAGPIGLYLAYQLKKKGVADVVVYDPRAGVYIRPGFVNNKDYLKLKKALGKAEESSSVFHIKDVERTLYDEVAALNVPIERKQFIRFHEAPQKGVVVLNDEGKEELIECDYVFDCTGSQRQLVKALNEIITPAPFTVQDINQSSKIKKYLLAYVQMKDSDYLCINRENNRYDSTKFFKTSAQFVEVMNKLRAFGWKEFGLPHLQGASFGKQKVCLYTSCPDNLPPESYDHWLKAVIDSSTDTTHISFSHLKPSQKYERKPRMSSFIVAPKVVREAAYAATNLPISILMGDSQIEPNAVLGHGITDGLDRVDAFVSHIRILNGTIDYFVPGEYQELIATSMLKHENAILDENRAMSKYYNNRLVVAEKNYIEALNSASEPLEIDSLAKTLKEIRARISYNEATTLLLSLTDIGTDNFFNTHATEEILEKVFIITQLMSQASKNLPPLFAVEKDSAGALLVFLTPILQECGNRLLHDNNVEKALDAYYRVLGLHRLLGLSTFQQEAFTVRSKIVISYRQINRHNTAVAEGISALKEIPLTNDFLEIRRALLYNVLKSLLILIKETSSHDKVEASSLQSQGRILLDQHSSVLETEMTCENDWSLFYTTIAVLNTDAVSEETSLPKVSNNSNSFWPSHLATTGLPTFSVDTFTECITPAESCSLL